MTVYANSIILDQTFLNNQVVVNVNCNNRTWLNNTMYAAFYLCHNLQSVTGLNDNVTDISGAFYECNNLTNIPSIPNSVTNMSGTFYHCINLVNIPAIPSNLSNAAYTFAGCSNLTTTPNLPDTITNMWGTFGDCINLTSITQIPNVTSLPVTYANTGITDLPIIPDSVTDLSGTFMGCSNLGDLANTTNTFANNINITHMNATFYNSGITSIPNLPSNVVYLTNTFANCQNLTKISKDIPSTVIDLGGCFYNCTNMQGIVNSIPSNTTNISNMFSFCRNLVINIPTLPASINSMDYAFRCTNINTSPSIQSNTITSLKGTFYGCTNLQNIPTIPNSVTNLYKTFSNCTSLTSIASKTIPESVTNMVQTFYNCTNLTNNILIVSENITNAQNCFSGTLAKNVYIPYKYTNNEYTKTYNSFINAGYDELGTTANVFLKDSNCSTYILSYPDDSHLLLKNLTEQEALDNHLCKLTITYMTGAKGQACRISYLDDSKFMTLPSTPADVWVEKDSNIEIRACYSYETGSSWSRRTITKYCTKDIYVTDDTSIELTSADYNA